MLYRTETLNTLAQVFGTIEDPGDNRGKLHRLPDIFILAIIGTLWGHTDFVNMCDELKYHEEYFTEVLGLLHGIPSHDTFSAVFSLIDPYEFSECFIEWLGDFSATKGHQIAIDGKGIRAACDKVHKGKVPYLVNAFMVETGLCIGQLKTNEKTNEIKGIPEMLKWPDLDGAVVTIDAIGCRRDIVKKIKEKGAQFVLPVKDNQQLLHKDILLEMQEQIVEKQVAIDIAKGISERTKTTVEPKLNSRFDEYVQNNSGHGRIERRSYYVLNDASCVDITLRSDVMSVGLVHRERLIIHRDKDDNIIEEEKSDEIETYIMSQHMSAEEFACYVRGHWSIENCLHWVLDDFFREDRCTARAGHATENLGLLRKIVFNLMALDPNVEKKSKKAKQVYFRNDTDAMLRLIFDYVPSKHESIKY